MANSMVLFSSGGGGGATFLIKPERVNRSPAALNFNRGRLNSAIHKNAISPQSMKQRRMQEKTFRVYSSVPGVDPSAAAGSASSSGSWKGWALGIVVSIILPLLSNKFGSFLKFKDKVETVVERAEQIVDTVEKVAEKVEQVAEGVLQKLPAGNLKNVVSVIENVAEKTGDGAELIGDLIDKAQEVDEKAESLVERAGDVEDISESFIKGVEEIEEKLESFVESVATDDNKKTVTTDEEKVDNKNEGSDVVTDNEKETSVAKKVPKNSK